MCIMHAIQLFYVHFIFTNLKIKKKIRNHLESDLKFYTVHIQTEMPADGKCFACKSVILMSVAFFKHCLNHSHIYSTFGSKVIYNRHAITSIQTFILMQSKLLIKFPNLHCKAKIRITRCAMVLGQIKLKI